MKVKEIPGIPTQKKGSLQDTESRRNFEDSQSTFENFEILKRRFLSINEWKRFGGKDGAEFKLYDANGNHISRDPQEDDRIRIDIPGPGNPKSNGYEWVKITEIKNNILRDDEMENLIMICVPTHTPVQNKNTDIAHFYAETSSSNFIISRGEKFIRIGIYGRNETPNMKTNLIGKIRNMMIALGGMIGISKIQWKSFADGILDF